VRASPSTDSPRDYNGTRRLYERLGFSYDRPKGLRNCVMVKTVDPA
jgi:hypothetical protein